MLATTMAFEDIAFDAPIAIPLPETLKEGHNRILLRGVRTPSALAGLLMPAMALMQRLTVWRSHTPRLSQNRAGPCRMPCAVCHVLVRVRPAGP